MFVRSRRVLLLALLSSGCLLAQTMGLPQPGPPQAVPLINVGGNYMESRFATFDFAMMELDEQNKKARKQAEENKKLVDSGTVSVLDLQAPAGAVREFNTAATLLGKQKAQEAVAHLQKAIKQYKKFVSAHNNLGLAYQDLGENDSARAEYSIATTLDAKFAAPFVNLGRLELAEKNYSAAVADFERATALQPVNAGNLTLLAYAQHGAHQYSQAVATAVRVHRLDHKGLADVHYIASASAIALRDYATVRRELQLFLQEDPANPLAPAAKQNLEILARNAASAGRAAAAPGTAPQGVNTFPNSERLRNQLAVLDGDTDDACGDCPSPDGRSGNPADPPTAASPDRPVRGFVFHKTVEEVAVFFAVTSHGHTVTDLQPGDLTVLDANRPPQKLLQFAPQSKLPLHVGLLIDTSGSVQQRFSFEKRAAAKFLRSMISNDFDLAFVAGFALSPDVTQDFTSNLDQLSAGIEKLDNNGGTALFDAVSFGCWKLAAYPERERVANVLVVLSDGEDNSSHNSLRQTIRDAENTGVTVYTISTADHTRPESDADKVLLEMAERTGGEAMFPGDLMSLGHSFQKLRDLIRSRYLVAYKPADLIPNGKYHSIRIIAQKNGHRFQVHARKGYYARLAPSRPAAR